MMETPHDLVEKLMGLLTDHVEDDLYEGHPLATCLRRLAAYIDAWMAGHEQAHEAVEARIARLEAIVNADRQFSTSA